MKANGMFRSLGFKDMGLVGDRIGYSYETDYEIINVMFRTDIFDYYVYKTNWIANNEAKWNAMRNNNEFKTAWEKHCAAQGYWQAQTIVEVGMELLEAIYTQIKEIEDGKIKSKIQKN